MELLKGGLTASQRVAGRQVSPEDAESRRSLFSRSPTNYRTLSKNNGFQGGFLFNSDFAGPEKNVFLQPFRKTVGEIPL
jgi:hypothetical protein